MTTEEIIEKVAETADSCRVRPAGEGLVEVAALVGVRVVWRAILPAPEER